MFRRVLTAGVFVVVVAVAVSAPVANAGDAGRLTSQQLTTIRVGTIPITDMAPFYLGLKTGIFKRAGLDVQPTVLLSGPANIAALVGGSVDIGFTATVPLLAAQSQNVPVRIVCGVTLQSRRADRGAGAMLVPGDSPLRSVADLRGKTIGVPSLNASDHVMVLEYLDQHGVDPASVRFLEVPFPSMVAALAARRVDAAIVAEPFRSRALSQDGFRTLLEHGQVIGKSGQIAMWITSTDYAQRYPRRLNAFAKAWRSAVQYANSHLAEVRQIVTEYTVLTPEQAAIVRLPWWSAGLNVVSIVYQARLSQKYNFIKTAVDPRVLLLPSVIRALAPKTSTSKK